MDRVEEEYSTTHFAVHRRFFTGYSTRGRKRLVSPRWDILNLSWIISPGPDVNRGGVERFGHQARNAG